MKYRVQNVSFFFTKVERTYHDEATAPVTILNLYKVFNCVILYLVYVIIIHLLLFSNWRFDENLISDSFCEDSPYSITEEEVSLWES